MIDPIDLQGLYGWLRARGADASLVSYLSTELTGPDLGVPENLTWEECELVVEGLLVQACEPRVDERRLDRASTIATRFGIDEEAVAALIHDRLGTTEPRLRAFGVLGLPLASTPAEIKATHRTIAKALHPDRLSMADPEARRAAERLMARLNQARTVLQAKPVVVELEIEDPDDVGLDEPSFDEDDMPTETEVDLSDLLEECR